jgi:hypothetical protein
LLDGDVGGESPEVGVGDETGVGVFFGDGFEEGEGYGWEACCVVGESWRYYFSRGIRACKEELTNELSQLKIYHETSLE